MTTKPESYEQDANDYATAVATCKVEKMKSQHTKTAVAIATGEFLAQISFKASELTETQIREKHTDLFAGTEADLNNSFFIKEHYAHYPKNFQTVQGEFSTDIGIRVEELLASKSAKFDDYYATAFADALSEFEKAFNAVDFTLIPYMDWQVVFSSKTESPNRSVEVTCG